MIGVSTWKKGQGVKAYIIWRKSTWSEEIPKRIRILSSEGKPRKKKGRGRVTRNRMSM